MEWFEKIFYGKERKTHDFIFIHKNKLLFLKDSLYKRACPTSKMWLAS
jgi:hypothetical protein